MKRARKFNEASRMTKRSDPIRSIAYISSVYRSFRRRVGNSWGLGGGEGRGNGNREELGKEREEDFELIELYLICSVGRSRK